MQDDATFSLSASDSLVKNGFNSSPKSSTLIGNSAYVLGIVDHQSSNSYAASLALSSHKSIISLRDPASLIEKANLSSDCSFSQIKVNKVGQLFSSTSDGFVIQWDDRSKNPIALKCLFLTINIWQPPLLTWSVVAAPDNRPLLCFDHSIDCHSVAAGGEYRSEEAPILFWDNRSPNRILRIHSSTHSFLFCNMSSSTYDDNVLQRDQAEVVPLLRKDEDASAIHIDLSHRM